MLYKIHDIFMVLIIPMHIYNIISVFLANY